MSYANLKILGNPVSNAGWQTLLTIGEANFIVEDTNFGVSSTEFYSFRIENSRVVYVLHKTNVSSIGAGRDGSLKIAISIPKGYKLKDTNPYLLLNELTEEFTKKYMTTKIDKFEYLPQSTNINEVDFTAILAKYELVETLSAFRPRDPQAKEIGKLVLSADKTEELLKDVHYSEFRNFANIVIAPEGQPTPQLSTIAIPRVPLFTIKQENYPTTNTQFINETIKYRAHISPDKADLFDNPVHEFTIKELIEGKTFEGITFNCENEEININIKPVLKPVQKKTDDTIEKTKISKPITPTQPEPPTKSDNIKLTIISRNQNFINESPIVLHLRNQETTDSIDSANIRLLRQPVYFRQINKQIQAEITLSPDWDKELIYGYIENRKQEKINLSFNDNDHIRVLKNSQIEATATELCELPLLDRIKKFALPALIALIAVALIGIGFAAGYFLPKHEPATQQTTAQEEQTAQNAPQENDTKESANPIKQEDATVTQDPQNTDYSQYIQYLKNLNTRLNEDDIRFSEIDELYDTFNRKKRDNSFKQFLNEDPTIIPIDENKYQPSFFKTKLETYKKAADWVRNKDYNKIKNENGKNRKYQNMKTYHKQCMDRITLGTYEKKENTTELKNYTRIERSQIEDMFNDSNNTFNSFKDLEKKLNLSN